MDDITKIMDMFELMHKENIEIARGLIQIGVCNRSAAEEVCNRMEERWEKAFRKIRGEL